MSDQLPVSPPPPPPDFTVTGTVNGRAVTIAWSAADGFDDPTGRTAVMVATDEQVCGTATGPCWPAAAKPARVAFLTAKQALDTVVSWTGLGDALNAELTALAAVPEGATP